MMKIMIGILCLSTSLTLAADPIPASDFARNAEFTSLKISPGGQYLATRVPFENQNALIIIDRKTMQTLSTVRFESNQQVGRFSWVNDSRIVASVLRPQSANNRAADFGELFAIDADRGRSQMIFGFRAGKSSTGTRTKRAEAAWAWGVLTNPLINDKKHVLVTGYPANQSGEGIPTVYKVNVYNGVKRPIMRLPLPQSVAVADSELERWASTGRDSKRRPLLHLRTQSKSDWKVVWEGDGPEHLLQPVAFTNDSLYVLSNIDTPTISLIELNLETKERNVIISHERYDMESAVFGSKPGELLAVCTRADRPRCFPVDLNHQQSGLMADLGRAFPEQSVSFSSWTRTGDFVSILVRSDRNPGDYFLIDTKELNATHIVSRRGWVKPDDMAPKNPISFSSRDGNTIEGYFTKPVGSEGPVPTVVVVHGGPHGPRDDWHYEGAIQLLASRGYGVLQINYRGSGGYGREFETSGHRKWGTVIQNDITDGVRWAIGKSLIDADRVCISGGSFGGYSAIMSAAREPDLYRCAIAHVGVYDLALMFRAGDIPGSRGGRAYLHRVLGSDEDALSSQSPVNHVDKIKAALMISYGQRDDRAPPIQSKRLIDALDAAGKPYELLVEGREGHGFVSEEARLRFFEKQLAFLDKHIRPEAR